jgi:phosphate regulon transcriptional regulator PhoB
MSKRRILIVDDEKNIVTALRYNLEREGYEALVASDGARALVSARKEMPDLILLDWMLPELDGLEVCRRLRQDERTRRIPVILLTVKSEETDKILGLEIGADDYVTKPFSQRELLARIKAVLRRAQPEPPAERFRLDDLQVDWGRHLVSVAGKPVELTHKEFHLLKALIEARGRVLSREALLDKVWGYDRAIQIETRTVDLHVSQLRRKLASAAHRIITLKNVGYRFVLDE